MSRFLLKCGCCFVMGSLLSKVWVCVLVSHALLTFVSPTYRNSSLITRQYVVESKQVLLACKGLLESWVPVLAPVVFLRVESWVQTGLSLDGGSCPWDFHPFATQQQACEELVFLPPAQQFPAWLFFFSFCFTALPLCGCVFWFPMPF